VLLRAFAFFAFQERSVSRLCSFLLVSVAVAACSAPAVLSPPQDAGVPQAEPDAGPATDGGGQVAPVHGLSLLSRLAGLWSGPATQTPVGDLPLMNVDFRDVTPRQLFGRVDLDQGNILRFGFSIETFDGEDVLVYRNGGYFQGLLRDMRTRLVEVDEAEGRYRFCHVASGCGYIDALFDFDGADRLLFDVKVKGAQHVLWDAERKEVRGLPAPFPLDESSHGPGTAPFPQMPSLRATVSWSQPLAEAADVWLLLSTSPCGFTGSCTISRSFKLAVPAGAQQAVLPLEQVHAGEYRVTAVLDRNRNMHQALRPDTGDGVSQPDASLAIAPEGETVRSLPIVATVP
jgi:hypothetical protein